MGKKSASVFTDTRLERVQKDLLEGMTNQYSVILHQIGENKNAETRFGNFINNTKVTPERILKHHWEQIDANWSSEHVLVASDTSTLTFPKRADRKGLGSVSDKTNKEGFDIHPSIFVNSKDGSVMGMGGINFIKNDFAHTEAQKKARKAKQADRAKRPFEEKQTHKWFTSPTQAITNAPSAARFTLMGDRETDIFELMQKTLDEGWDFLYRNRMNRVLSKDSEYQKLHDTLASWAGQHTYYIDLPTTKKRTAHQAKLHIKFGSVKIARPKMVRGDDMPKYIKLQVVEVKEDPATVVEGEKPIRWILFTSHPVFSVAQALQIIQWYQWRWTIEELFRSLKTKGLNIESSEVETLHGLSNLTTLGLIAAVKTMQLVKARDGNTMQKINDAFSEKEIDCMTLLNKKLEGNTAKSSNPFPNDSLAYASWVIGRLGGWNGYKKSRPPGPIIMTRGLAKFYFILQGYSLML